MYFLFFFVKDRSKYVILVNTPFKKWVNVHKVVKRHPSNLNHLNEMADSSVFFQSVETPQHNVDVCINSALVKTIEENRHNLLFCPVYFILWQAMPGT